MEINNKYKAYNTGKKDKKGMKSSDFNHADVLSPEAIWLLPEYKMHGQSHTVYRLAVQLPGEKENMCILKKVRASLWSSTTLCYAL